MDGRRVGLLVWKKGTWSARVVNREGGGTWPPLEVEHCPPLEVHDILGGVCVRTSQEAHRHLREVQWDMMGRLRWPGASIFFNLVTRREQWQCERKREQER